jgi:hypothetical protein
MSRSDADHETVSRPGVFAGCVKRSVFQISKDPVRFTHPTKQERRRWPFDWRGWIILAWVVWFGLLYGKMVIEQRGGKLKEWIAGAPK